MNLNQIAKEIREIIEQRQKELELTFVEDKHIYYMKDTEGNIRNDYMSVSKLIKKFYTPFDSVGKSLQMCDGDPIEAQKLQEQWILAGDYSTNMGSRVHYLLESDLVKQYDEFKEVRQPIFTCDQTQIEKSDAMVNAGKEFLNLMHERGAVLLDTEMILGDPELKYTGQPDKFWLMMNKDKTDFGFVTTDWKTNQKKNFEVQWYNKYLHSPFNDLRDYALTHYYLQLPFYARLFLKMLKGSKYENLKLLGCVVVHLKDDGTFTEYKVPKEVNKKVFSLNLSKYTK